MESDQILTTPKRIQRLRTKGWRMPPGAIYVGRPTKWGNPFDNPLCSTAYLVECYRSYAAASPKLRVDELRGKDLVCWCPLVDKDGNPVPCHADILLELANG